MSQASTSAPDGSFAALAEAFVSHLRNAGSRPPRARLAALHELLPRLYAAALRLPETKRDEEDAEVDVETSRPALDDLATYLGERRYYRTILDPDPAADEGEVIGDVLDDLVDLGRDLEAGLAAWRADRRPEAAWRWRFSFRTHWGSHATGLLRALHALEVAPPPADP